MKSMIAVAFFLLAGCSHFDYPGRPKDIARQNKLIQEKTKVLDEQSIVSEKWTAKRKSEEYSTRQFEAMEKNRAQHALYEEQRKANGEKNRIEKEALIREMADGAALENEERKASLGLNQKYAKDIERHIKRQLNQSKFKIQCRFEGNGSETDEVLCSIITSKTDRRALHDLQSIAYHLAVDLRRAYPLSYSIFAQTSDDTPLARFMYNNHFDTLTPLIFWH